MTLGRMSSLPAADADDPWPEAPVSAQRDLVAETNRFLASGAWNRPALAALLRGMPAAALVVTGQQPAVGGGPLYTLVKAASAIAVARSLAEVAGGAAPLFWCASEDHDLGEAGHADIITRSGIVQRLHVDLGSGRAALRHRPASLWWDALVAHCRRHLGPGPGAAWLESQRPVAEEGMGRWLCRLLEQLFAAYGLRCIEGHELRPLWHAGLQAALASWPAQSLEERRTRLLAHGQPDAFGALPEPPLFADRPAGRMALSRAEAVGLFAREPDALSPGAALRPVLQQIALPAAIYVAGPGELSYHAFIAPLYAALGAVRPRVLPRASMTLVPNWLTRGLAQWGRSVEDLGTTPPPLRQKEALGAELAQLKVATTLAEQRAATLGEAMQRRAATGIAHLRRDLARLELSLARGEAQAQALPPWGALTGYLRPRGVRQERSMSLFQAIWEHGPGVVHRLVETASACAYGEHRFTALTP